MKIRKMKYRIVIVSISLIFLSAFFIIKNNKTNDLTKIHYKSNLEPLKNHFPFLNDITLAYWKSGTYENSRIAVGPSDTWLKGFMILSNSKFELIQSEFKWDNIEILFDKGISPDITGFNNFDWHLSEDFSKFINQNVFTGKLYLDKNNQVIYFDLSTY